jgi:hypothetical protein
MLVFESEPLFISKLFEDQNIPIVPIESSGKVRRRIKNDVAVGPANPLTVIL